MYMTFKIKYARQKLYIYIYIMPMLIGIARFQDVVINNRKTHHYSTHSLCSVTTTSRRNGTEL